MATAYDPPLDMVRQRKFLTMCYSRPLPYHYLPNETNRMALAYFILASIDILDPSSFSNETQPTTTEDGKPRPTPIISPADRPRLRKWILAHQHPMGGFCGSPSTILPQRAGEEWDFDNEKPDYEKLGHAQLPATKFALQMLAMLAYDDVSIEGAFDGVDRLKTLEWLRRLQREDGSFGENLAEFPNNGWYIGGGHDLRHIYLAASVRWMLRGDVKEGDPSWVEDIDIDRLVKYIADGQTYDGGWAQSSEYEPHAGYAYCAIAALSLLDRPLEGSKAYHPSKTLQSGIRDVPRLAHWLVSRQIIYLEPEPNASGQDEEGGDDDYVEPPDLSVLCLDENLRHVGVNGRSNKVADTCYCWWVGASLATLGYDSLIHRESSRRFLVEKTAHLIGGFGKRVGSPPDIYHTCLGLAALAVMGEPGLNEFDESLVVSTDTVRKIERARKAMLSRQAEVANPENAGKKLLELQMQAIQGERPAWLKELGL